MKKIISFFQRNYEGDRLVRDEIVPGAEWVAAGEGIATRKWDGTCCMIRDGRFYKRYDVKPGHLVPRDFEAAQEADPATGHWPGWVPIRGGPEDQYFREAMDLLDERSDGTYELCGPKVQGNPEGFLSHILIPHGAYLLEDVPRTFTALREWLRCAKIEGIVWHHPDGRMVKIKARDFGIKR